jgi:hypothetical protein
MKRLTWAFVILATLSSGMLYAQVATSIEDFLLQMSIVQKFAVEQQKASQVPTPTTLDI